MSLDSGRATDRVSPPKRGFPFPNMLHICVYFRISIYNNKRQFNQSYPHKQLASIHAPLSFTPLCASVCATVLAAVCVLSVAAAIQAHRPRLAREHHIWFEHTLRSMATGLLRGRTVRAVVCMLVTLLVLEHTSTSGIAIVFSTPKAIDQLPNDLHLTQVG